MTYRRSGQDYTYENYLRYGAKTMPKLRQVHPLGIEMGLVLGFRGREAAVPEGYCTRLQNFVPRNDGTYAIRPPWFVGPEWDPNQFDTLTTLSSQIIATFPDGGVLSVHGRSEGTEGSTFSRDGFTPLTGSDTGNDLQFIYGNAAHWGNTSIVPYTLWNLDSDTVTVRAALIEYNDDLTMTRTITNLTDLFDHFPYVYEDVDVEGSVYSRTFALTWKGRSFILAGTGLSYSGPLQPGNFSIGAGGGFIPLDTSAPITGAFILQDIMYICTEAELFTLGFETDPGRNRQLRTHSKIQCLGALEHDNVGYIATTRGLYRISNNQLIPTFIPSDQSYYNTKVTGDLDGSVFPLDTDSVFIPRIAGLHRFGDLILIAGLGFNADRRFGTPAGDTYRYPVFSTSTEVWVEWTGPDWLAGGIFAPVNALPIFQGPLTPDLGFPASHSIYMYYSERPLVTDLGSRGFININATNEVLELLDNGTTDPNVPVITPTPPFLDVKLDILFPHTDDVSSEHEAFAIDVITSSGFEVFLMTGRMTFGAPFTWKRLHRYWIEANLYGAGALADNSFMFWRFFTPHSEENGFAEQEHNRFDNWLNGSDSMRNQTPGHLLSRDDPTLTSRFTSVQLALYWRSPLQIGEPEPLNENTDFETDADNWQVDNGTITRSDDEAAEGSWSGLIEPDGNGIVVVRPVPDVEVTQFQPYSLDYRLFGLSESIAVFVRLIWKNDPGVVVGTDSDINGVPFELPAGEWVSYIIDSQAIAHATKVTPELELQHQLPDPADIRVSSAIDDVTIEFFDDMESYDGTTFMWEPVGGSATISVSTINPYAGIRSLNIFPNGGHATATVRTKLADSPTVEEGKTYNIVGRVFKVAGTKSVRLSIEWYDDTDTLISATTPASSPSTLGVWRRHARGAIAPAGAVKASLVFSIMSTPATSDIHRIDNFALVEIEHTLGEVEKPIGTEEGDFMIAISNHLFSSNNLVQIFGGTPWNFFEGDPASEDVSFNAANNRIKIWTKFAGPSEPETYEMDWVTDANTGLAAVTILSMKNPVDVSEILWAVGDNTGFVVPEGIRTAGIPNMPRGNLELRILAPLVDFIDDGSVFIPPPQWTKLSENYTMFGWGHAVLARRYHASATSPNRDFAIQSSADSQRLGITLSFLRSQVLRESDKLHLDEASISLTPTLVTFDPDTPKWAENGLGRIYADVTEYKPSHTGI